MMQEVYLHINNGGVIVSAGSHESTGQLMFRVRGTHFGNTTNLMEIFTNSDSMRKIGEMFIAASEQPHEVYSFAAVRINPQTSPESESEGCSSGPWNGIPKHNMGLD
jgi:hypothetical protein